MAVLRTTLRGAANALLASSERYSALVNRVLWNRYASHWRPGLVELDLELGEADRDAHIGSFVRTLGDEWGTPADVAEVVETFIIPYVGPESAVAEIGVGGGRIAAQLVNRVGIFYGFDISREMLKRAKEKLGERSAVNLILLRSPNFPRELSGTVDFAYSFDVFVHLELRAIHDYLEGLRALLRPGAHGMIHTHTVTTPLGWEYFAGSKRFVISRHFFYSPELIDTLLMRTGFDVVQRSDPTGSNLYFDRDYMVVFRKR